MSYLLSFSPIDLCKSFSSFSFGFGAAVGIGYIFRKVKREQERRQEHLLSCLRQLSAEVRQLRETLITQVAAAVVGKQEQNVVECSLSTSDDDEYFDTEKGSEPCVEDHAQFLEKIDNLQNNGSSAEQQDAYNILISRTNQDPENKDLLWRYAKAQFQISCLKEKAGDLDGQKFMLSKGIVTGEAAIEADRNNHEAYKWYAILLGVNIQFMSLQNKVIYAYKYKENVEKALALNPKDAQCHNLMGRYCFEVFMLPWYERTAASAIFGDNLATVDDALKHFLKAKELEPNLSLENSLFIGKCYYQKWEYAEAQVWLREVIKSPPIEPESESIKAEALQLIKKCT